MARQNEIYTQADANGDGLLDAEEYKTYYDLNKAEKTAEGSWVDPREDRATTQYTVINRINSDQEGVSFADIETMIRVGMPRMAELRAADGL